MKSKPSVVAQRLLNLYRQEHVIIGGWSAVNPVFINEAEPDVLEILRDLPTGKNLIQHIENLRSGKTSMDSIDHDLLPYGGLMTQSELTSHITKSELEELKQALNTFEPNQQSLNAFQNLPVVKRFGDQWVNAIRTALDTQPELLKQWDVVYKTNQAYNLWDIANKLVNEPVSERVRAEIQADMPDYETYLPMFGNDGENLLTKLRAIISVREPLETDNAPDAPQSI